MISSSPQNKEKTVNDTYQSLAIKIERLLNELDLKIGKRAGSDTLITYWNIGRDIVDAEGNHAKTFSVRQLVKKLEAYDLVKVSRSQLTSMRKFALEYSSQEISQEPFLNLGWSHHIILFEKVKNKQIRIRYAELACEWNWSPKELRKHIDSSLHLKEGDELAQLAKKTQKVIKNSAANMEKKLLIEWSNKNDKRPDEIALKSGYNAWWKCSRDSRHPEWRTTVAARVTKGIGCPCCSGRVAWSHNSLLFHDPETAKLWDHERNDQGPERYLPTSPKNVYWRCDKNPDHQWEAAVGVQTARKRENKCAICSRQVASPEYNLALIHPEIAKEWRRELNDGLPEDYLPSSNKRVSWQCDLGHPIWEAKISTRTSKLGRCPYCAGQWVLPETSLKFKHPDLFQQIHHTLNEGIDLGMLMPGSHQKIWWSCSEDNHPPWQASVQNRACKGKGCPYCSGRFATEDNCLAVTHPELVEEWDYERNVVSPYEVKSGTNSKAHWICKKDKTHLWRAIVASRANKGTGCPYCSNIKLHPTNCLAAVSPALAKEFHPDKNNALTPRDVIASATSKKYWWKCDHGHEWQSSMGSRLSGQACRACKPGWHSKTETRIACELFWFVDFDIYEHIIDVDGARLDVDIVMRDIKTVVEYDGSYWHADRMEADKKKTALLQKDGWKVLRVREEPLNLLSQNNISAGSKESPVTVAARILRKLKLATSSELEQYLLADSPLNDKLAEQIIREHIAMAQARKSGKKSV